MQQETRRGSRSRTRLRPAKVLTLQAGFIADCAMIDRSEAGARLRFFAQKSLPPEFLILDETALTLQPAQTIWTAGTETGVRFVAPVRPVTGDLRERIAGRFYAIKN